MHSIAILYIILMAPHLRIYNSKKVDLIVLSMQASFVRPVIVSDKSSKSKI
jgi:hypothetical protein